MKKYYLIHVLIFLVVVFLAVIFSIVINASDSVSAVKIGQIIQEETVKTAAKEDPIIPKASKYDVPILMYHYIRDAKDEDQLGKNLSVHPANFEEHVKWMQKEGYTSVKLTDLADPEKKAISKALNDKKKPIVITFDDGYLDAYTQAFPVLKKYQMTGTFFIIRNSVGNEEYMNQNQIDELENAGMEIGSHTLSHPNLASLDEESQLNQVTNSKDDATTFCYPAGKYNEITTKLVKEAGYLAAVTTKFGIANEASDLMELRRVRVEDGDALTLQHKIEAAYEQTMN